MKNNYTLINVYEMIVKSEFEFKEDIIKYGRESWPITRNIIWISLINLREENKVKKRNAKFQFIFRNLNYKVFRRLLINSFNNIIYGFTKKKFLKECKVIFFSRSIYLERLSSGKLFDRIIDPIYMSSLFNNKSLKVYLDNPILKNKFFLKGINYFPNKFYNKNKFDPIEYKRLEESCFKLLKSFIELNSLKDIEELLLTELKKSIKYYLVSKNKSKKYFSKFTSLKKIFLISWYVPDTMGIIASARQLGIATIEVQHGQQGKFHAGNSGWNFFPENGYLNMPDKFWCWDEKSIKNILKQSPNRKFHKPILGGYSWPIWYKTHSKTNDNKNSIKATKIRLLFTMQIKQGLTNNEPLPKVLLELIKYYENLYNKTSAKIFEIKIRLHPNCLSENLSYLKKRLDKSFESDLVTYSSKLNGCFYDDLLWSSHHLTLYSSCALEALIFGIKSAVYGDVAYKIYEEEIKSQSIKFLKLNSLDEILNWLNENINDSSNSEKNVLESFFPDPNLIL